MLQDAIWADGARLESDAAYKDTAIKFVAASLQGWAFCRDNVDDCAALVTEKGSQLGLTHQTWQMNEINKLIWPAAKRSATSWKLPRSRPKPPAWPRAGFWPPCRTKSARR